MQKESLEIILRFKGPEVDDGSMSIADIVPVLQGFSGAYGKLAATADPSSSHRIRITGVRRGSADIVLEAWKWLADNNAAITSAGVIGTGVLAVTGGAAWIVKRINGVIALKRHTKKRPFRERIQGNNLIAVQNAENVELIVPLDVYEIFKSGTLDADLSRLTSPLLEGCIDVAEVEARPADGEIMRETITAEERPYFAVDEATTVASTNEAWLVGKLNSLTKSTNSGWLYLTDGTRVFYRYIGEDASALHTIFGTYNGSVKIRCIAHMDENLKVAQIDISEIERVQSELFPSHPRVGEPRES
jgi:hypothetical protein